MRGFPSFRSPIALGRWPGLDLAFFHRPSIFPPHLSLVGVSLTPKFQHLSASSNVVLSLAKSLPSLQF
eukprot:SAG11_NODE_1674_length_4478_cov_2.341631_3_plen_68_part_00